MPKGPRTRLTDELIAKIAGSVRSGNYVQTACARYGIPSSTAAEWRARGKKRPGTIYGKFADAMAVAEAEAEEYFVQLVVTESRHSGKLAMGFLSRRWADRYGRRDNLVLEGNVNAPVRIDSAKERIVNRLEALRVKELGAGTGDDDVNE